MVSDGQGTLQNIDKLHEGYLGRHQGGLIISNEHPQFPKEFLFFTQDKLVHTAGAYLVNHCSAEYSL